MRNYTMYKSGVGYTEFRVQSNGDYELTGYAWITVHKDYMRCYKRIVSALEADEITTRLLRKEYFLYHD